MSETRWILVKYLFGDIVSMDGVQRRWAIGAAWVLMWDGVQRHQGFCLGLAFLGGDDTAIGSEVYRSSSRGE